MVLAMRTITFVTHPDVLIDPSVPVPDWTLSLRGRDRMVRGSTLPWLASVGTLWCSTERKARDGAEIWAGRLGVALMEWPELGENDRSATGYLPREEFEAMADRFFAHPDESVCGWERASDAQRRIVRAVEHVIAAPQTAPGDVAIIAHGGVGTLLLCHLQRVAIGRAHDQPANNGGNYFAFDADTRSLHHGWRAIDGPAAVG